MTQNSLAAPAAIGPAHPAGSVLTGFAALVGAALAMSVSPTLVRLADVGPFASAFWRVALALPVLWVWMRRADAGSVVPMSARFSWPIVLAGLSFTGDLLFWHTSVMRTTIANATFFATLAPLWVMVFGWLLFRDRVDRTVLWGLGVCLAGGSALVAQSLTFAPAHVVGDGLGVVTGMFFGLYFLAVRSARGEASAARVTFEQSVVTAAVLLAVSLVLEPGILPHSGRGWLVLLTLALVSHVGGQGLLALALGRLPVAFSSLVIFLESISAALVAWAVLGEAVAPIQALGGLAIVAGIWVARPRADRSAGAVPA